MTTAITVIWKLGCTLKIQHHLTTVKAGKLQCLLNMFEMFDWDSLKRKQVFMAVFAQYGCQRMGFNTQNITLADTVMLMKDN